MGLIRTVLKKPVTVLMIIVCLIVFGFSSVITMNQELTPEIEMPMMIVAVTYPGASPEDINDLIAKPIEDAAGSLQGVNGITSSSSENIGLVLLEYDYDMDIDDAYDDLKKEIDLLEATEFPEDAGDAMIVEMNVDDMPVLSMIVESDSIDNVFDYVDANVVPEFETLPSVAEVTINGGQENYISVSVNREKLQQYRLSTSMLANYIATADFAYPAGTMTVGDQDLSISTSVECDTVEALKKVPIALGNGSTILLGDVADISYTKDDATSISRYQGRDAVSIFVKKQQGMTALECSRDVQNKIEELEHTDPALNIEIIDDTSETIKETLFSVFETMILAVVISMGIIWFFFGNIKASAIVGTSIPISILTALILLGSMDQTLNLVTMTALVLGVGMMVDNSIVVLESCYRATDMDDPSCVDYEGGALSGTKNVMFSVIGSTLTTCVVFIPLTTISGMSGQLFKPLGYTVVFCMVASLLSAITVVPLCYKQYKPLVNANAPAYRPVEKLREKYRICMRFLLRYKKTVLSIAVLTLVCAILLATLLPVELIPADDRGVIAVTIEMKPGTTVEAANQIMKKVEAVIIQDPNLEDYLATYGSSSMSIETGTTATINAYLKDDCKIKTKDLARQWQSQLSGIGNCTITAESSSSMAMMPTSDSFELILKGTNYDELKYCADDVVNRLYDYPDLYDVHSSLENAAPVIDIKVDPIMAEAEGLSPIQIGVIVNQMISGIEATTMEVNGKDASIRVEYPEGSYDTLEKLKSASIPTNIGSTVELRSIAQIGYKDSPDSIIRQDEEYMATITAQYRGEISGKDEDALIRRIKEEAVEPLLTGAVHIGETTMDQQTDEEFGALAGALATAIFLVFVVMASQFESPRYSLMVMSTIPFCLIGVVIMLLLTGNPLSMMALIGLLILIGTVVNNGILYVDTVNQLRKSLPLNKALIDAGSLRLRPILMTTLTTVLSMIPMLLSTDGSASMTKGIAAVNIGGLTIGTIMALFVLPVLYAVTCKNKE